MVLTLQLLSWGIAKIFYGHDVFRYTLAKYALSFLAPRRYCVRLHGCKFLVRRGSLDLWHVSPLYEPNITSFIIKKSLAARSSSKAVFIDVGAHIGRYTVLAATALKPGGRVIALEPNPQTYRALLDNIHANLLHNVIALQAAAGRRAGFVDLSIVRVDDGQSSVALVRGDRVVRVPVVRIDDVLLREMVDPEDVYLMKIDVEGAEADVIAGASRLLETGNAEIIFEAWGDEELQRARSILEGYGYRVVGKLGGRNFLARKAL